MVRPLYFLKRIRESSSSRWASSYQAMLDGDARDTGEGKAQFMRDLGLRESVRPLGQQFHDVDAPRESGNGKEFLLFCHDRKYIKIPLVRRKEM